MTRTFAIPHAGIIFLAFVAGEFLGIYAQRQKDHNHNDAILSAAYDQVTAANATYRKALAVAQGTPTVMINREK